MKKTITLFLLSIFAVSGLFSSETFVALERSLTKPEMTKQYNLVFDLFEAAQAGDVLYFFDGNEIELITKVVVTKTERAKNREIRHKKEYYALQGWFRDRHVELENGTSPAQMNIPSYISQTWRLYAPNSNLVIISSPLFMSAHEPDFNFIDEDNRLRFGSFKMIAESPRFSPFGTLGYVNSLPEDFKVYWVNPKGLGVFQGSTPVSQAVSNFWTYYFHSLCPETGGLVFFSHDFKVLREELQDRDNLEPFRVRISPDEDRVQRQFAMITIGDRGVPVIIQQFKGEDLPPEQTEENGPSVDREQVQHAPTVNVGLDESKTAAIIEEIEQAYPDNETLLAIFWGGELASSQTVSCDLDLYLFDKIRSKKPVSFRNKLNDYAQHVKDILRPGISWEVIKLSSVPDGLRAYVNCYKASGVQNPIKGKFMIRKNGQTYVSSFQLNVNDGNMGALSGDIGASAYWGQLDLSGLYNG